MTLSVVSCYTCDAPKACCSLLTSAYLYEVVPTAARLIREGRDTPELRAQLKQRAHAMETTPKKDYKLPCLFLGERELCTIYEDQSSVCAAATWCRRRRRTAATTPPSRSPSCPTRRSRRSRRRSTRCSARRPALRPLGESWPRRAAADGAALPRGVHRRDYPTFLAERVLPAAHRFEWAVK